MTSGTKSSLCGSHPKRIDVPILIFASTALLVAGLRLPILTVHKLWETNTFSVLSGIINLWNGKLYFLAAVIFFFSIVFPIVKLAALVMIWFVRMADRHRKWSLHCLALLGKWSMLDVFVTAILIVSVKLGSLASAKAEKGVYYFALSILLAMVVTSFENELSQKSNH